MIGTKITDNDILELFELFKNNTENYKYKVDIVLSASEYELLSKKYGSSCGFDLDKVDIHVVPKLYY